MTEKKVFTPKRFNINLFAKNSLDDQEERIIHLKNFMSFVETF